MSRQLIGLMFIGLVLTGCQKGASEPVNVSGIYPHMAMFNKQRECGIGAVVNWQDRLWVITYAPHKPEGSDDKLYEIDRQFNMTIRPESVGGTPANRMIHRESKQLIIGPYFIDQNRDVRVISPDQLPGRFTATARHLTDPANQVYMLTMEEGLYEVDVKTLAVRELYEDANKRNPADAPWLPGYHGKGGYTAQGRVVYSNNGEWGAWSSPVYDKQPSGCLAQWNGKEWHVVERTQFTEVTGPGGIYGNARTSDPLWATGWDYRSVMVKLLDDGQWYRYRLPKASHTYDARHGWFTEWPRIRAMGDDRLLMTMHGMFYEFPKTFSAKNTSGIKPLSSYLKIIADWDVFNRKLVFACDDASIFANSLCDQSQSNLWFVKPTDLTQFGPRDGCGGVWINDTVTKNQISDPYLFTGYKQRMACVSHNASTPVTFNFEVDRKGDGHWSKLMTMTVPADGFKYHLFNPNVQGQWIRAKVDTDCDATVYFHYADQPETIRRSDGLFNSLAKKPMNDSFGLIRPRGEDKGTLHFAAWKRDAHGKVTEAGYYEIDADMKLKRVDDTQAHQWLKNKAKIAKDYQSDKASIIVTDSRGKRWRLPKGLSQVDGLYRGKREVVTERSLWNCGGTIYELPRELSGEISKMKPVATHGRLIYDYCSWRGMLVISGCKTDATNDGHYFASDDGQVGLWFGTIDDLWKLGKPRGEGGPLKETAIKVGQVSDPYLMYGYDHKQLTLKHNATDSVNFTVEIDITGAGDWVTYDTFEVKAGQSVKHIFETGFSARWVRFKTDTSCKATAWLIYQ